MTIWISWRRLKRNDNDYDKAGDPTFGETQKAIEASTTVDKNPGGN
jgi:hypothetical protein